MGASWIGDRTHVSCTGRQSSLTLSLESPCIALKKQNFLTQYNAQVYFILSLLWPRIQPRALVPFIEWYLENRFKNWPHYFGVWLLLWGSARIMSVCTQVHGVHLNLRVSALTYLVVSLSSLFISASIKNKISSHQYLWLHPIMMGVLLLSVPPALPRTFFTWQWETWLPSSSITFIFLVHFPQCYYFPTAAKATPWH